MEDANANEHEVSLRQPSDFAGKTQKELAAALDVSQPALSRLEAEREDIRIGTLRQYLAGLGVHLGLVAVHRGKRLTLRGF